MNKIINPAFREGIVRAIAGCEEIVLSADAKERIIKDVEENWWFCGGRDTEPDSDTQCPYDTIEWERLWVYYHGGRDMPIKCTECVCLQDGLRYNLFITDGTRVITIGSQCMYQFLPRIASQVKQKRCSNCREPHKNRIDNYCKTCRPIMRERDIQEEKEAIWKETQERIKTMRLAEQKERERLEFLKGWLMRCPLIRDKIMIKRMEEQERKEIETQERAKKQEQENRRLEEKRDAMERVRLAKEKADHTCGCGVWKKTEFPRCWDCRVKYLASLSDVQKKALLCACGKTKKPSFTKCYGCFKG